jgi:hypothetical protein
MSHGHALGDGVLGPWVEAHPAEAQHKALNHRSMPQVSALKAARKARPQQSPQHLAARVFHRYRWYLSETETDEFWPEVQLMGNDPFGPNPFEKISLDPHGLSRLRIGSQ